MINLKQALVAGTISLLVLAGCSGNQQAATTTTASPDTMAASPAASPDTMAASPDATQANPEFTGLLEVVANTRAAVEAGDYTKAQTEFDQFESHWSKVEDGVKALSSDTYNAIEDNMDVISGELKAAQPDKDKVLAALQALEEQVNTAKS